MNAHLQHVVWVRQSENPGNRLLIEGRQVPLQTLQRVSMGDGVELCSRCKRCYLNAVLPGHYWSESGWVLGGGSRTDDLSRLCRADGERRGTGDEKIWDGGNDECRCADAVCFVLQLRCGGMWRGGGTGRRMHK
jgi:hypothetical protein